MNPLDFYNYTLNQFISFSNFMGIEDYEKYYEMTDYREDWVYIRDLGLDPHENEKQFIFAQFCYHAQNGGIILNIIKFYDNSQEHIAILKNAFCNFDPNQFILSYDNLTETELEDKVYNIGITWDRSKKKAKESSIFKLFKTLLNVAKFMRTYDTKKKILDYFNENNTSTKNLIKSVQQIGVKGFGVALACDFLKEFDESFNWLCKPDTHIISTMNKLSGNNWDLTDTNRYKVIEYFKKLVECINKELPNDDKITGYKLDRIIYLICSGNFFIDKVHSIKANYLKNIKK